MNKFSLICSVAIIFIFFDINVYGQISNEGILKKYVIKDSTDLNDAVLILYKNGTFINFGLVNNKKEREWYLWFASGVYTMLPDKVILTSEPETNDYGKLVSSIKRYYILRPDHMLIETSYEQQRDSYVNYPLLTSKDGLYDAKREFMYFEKVK
jgi:hypothetical protein